ncbi:hypothetical protein QWY28_10620 [Nocardioides sp. SOB77]|uniref:Uncharacterized protein n=1 Tax=Nocardioides oceani TaxID=3058369 RepID=A0ABT8FGX2_9ACTN|nr:hypothetical protein [Nocardioides oceani]MDN4173397.1 hypothetical protein [Nocardioides oceani]
MNEQHALIEREAHHQITERVARASTPKVRSSRRHQVARGLRRFADRLDG